MSNTKPKSVEAIVERVEAAVKAEEDQRKAEVADITARLSDAEQRAASAAQEPRNIETRWRAGEDVPALDYATAQAEAVKAETVVAGLQQRRNGLERSLSIGECEVADALVPIIETLLPGVPVVATYVDSKGMEDVPHTLFPAVIVTQLDATKRDRRTGSMSAGKVRVEYLRSQLHSPIVVSDLEHAARKAGAFIEVRSNAPFAPERSIIADDGKGSGSQGFGRDVLTLTVKGMYCGLPRFAEVGAMRVNAVSTGIAQDLIGWAKTQSSGSISGGSPFDKTGRGWVMNGGGLRVQSSGPAVEEENTPDGMRIVTLTEDLLINVDPKMENGRRVMEDSAAALVGTTLGGVGYVAELTVTGGGLVEQGTGQSSYRVRGVFHSLPEASPQGVDEAAA